MLQCQSLKETLHSIYLPFQAATSSYSSVLLMIPLSGINMNIWTFSSMCESDSMQSIGLAIRYAWAGALTTFFYQNICHISTSGPIEINHLFASIFEHVALSDWFTHVSAHTMTTAVANLIDIEKIKKWKWNGKKAGKEYNECADHADNGSKYREK